MKFKLKALAAALALVATLPAYADIATTASGNGSLVLTVLDTAANISATFDLGQNYSNFNLIGTDNAVSTVTASGTSFSWDLAGNANYSTAWGQFLTAAAGSLSSIQYAITAGDNLGAGAGSRGYITTYAGNPGTALTTSGLITATGNFDTFTTANGLLGNHSTVADGSNVATAGAAYANSAEYVNGKLSGTGPLTMGSIGSSLGVTQVVTGASSFAPVTATVFGNGAQFTLLSNGALSYTTNVAAVPEADTWAMMLLGLGFMGFVARRKQA